jgi:hypothetical protein
MEFHLSQHATQVMNERGIAEHWVVATINDPELRLPDPNDPEVERFYRRIPENENRVLRVVVNTNLAPWRIVSLFFDRNMKGKL